MKIFDFVIYSAGLETHGGPGAIGPRIFQMAPRFLRSGAQMALKFLEFSTYIYMFGPPDLGLGPQVFKSGGPSGPPAENRVSSPALDCVLCDPMQISLQNGIILS